MSEVLDYYKQKHILNFPETETWRGGVRILKAIRQLNFSKGVSMESIYKYARILDDATDESPLVQPVKEELMEEKNSLLKGAITNLQKELLGENLAACSPNQQQALRLELSRLIDTMLVDLGIRFTGHPLTENQLARRNLQVVWTPLDILSIHWSNKKLFKIQSALRLARTLAVHDNCLDLEYDLSRGLILMSQEDIETFGLEFQDGESVSEEGLVKYFTYTRSLLVRSFKYNLPAILKIGLPDKIDTMFYTYLSTRPQRLDQMPDFKGIFFKSPEDALLKGER